MHAAESAAFYPSPAAPLSFARTAARLLSDPASVIPATIYDEWAVELPGPGLGLVIAHPASVAEVLQDDGSTFGRGRFLRTMMRRAWGEGLAAAEGDAWAAQRHAAAPAFRPAAARAAAEAMAQATRTAAATWQDGQSIELAQTLGRVVAEVVLGALFTHTHGADIDAVSRDIPHVVREAGTFGLLDALPLPAGAMDRLRGLGRSAQQARLRALAQTIAARPDGRVQDLSTRLRGVGPLADNVYGFMVAGFETTALGAAWGIQLLAQHPEWQERLAAEASEAGGDPERLVMTRQVAQEALRLYPPAPLLVRTAIKRTQLLGFTLRRGQAVLIPVFAIHRHRQLWGTPDVFDPARFAAGTAQPKGAYLPFGRGPRTCIAAAFALTEITVILSELTRAFRFSPEGPPPRVSLRVSTHAPDGLHVRVHRIARRPGSPECG